MESSMPTAWFVVCISEDRPEGPGKVFGPFPTHELAEEDASIVSCAKNHVLVRGPGSEIVEPSNSYAAGKARHWYLTHPDMIPPMCLQYEWKWKGDL